MLCRLVRAKRMLTGRSDQNHFADVAGCDEGEEVELVEYLQRAEPLQKLGGKIPKGVRWNPGTGKTLLAKATQAKRNPFLLSLALTS